MRAGKLAFATIVRPEWASEKNVGLLVASIRAFAGSLSGYPIWCFVLGEREKLSQSLRTRFSDLGVELISLTADSDFMRFFFGGEATAAALAETIAAGRYDLLAWLAPNTVVVQQPSGFVLPKEKLLGYRPVHHMLIGSRFEEPLDSFWSLVYQFCEVPENRIFPMTPHIETTKLRPYFNSGILVTRPTRHLLRAWRDTFAQAYHDSGFQELLKQDARFPIFLHQAVLSGVILSRLRREDLLELPPSYNYPIHLYDEDRTGGRPRSVEELVTFRHESFHEQPDWAEKMPAKEPLKQWIRENLLPE